MHVCFKEEVDDNTGFCVDHENLNVDKTLERTKGKSCNIYLSQKTLTVSENAFWIT